MTIYHKRINPTRILEAEEKEYAFIKDLKNRQDMGRKTFASALYKKIYADTIILRRKGKRA